MLACSKKLSFILFSADILSAPIGAKHTQTGIKITRGAARAAISGGAKKRQCAQIRAAPRFRAAISPYRQKRSAVSTRADKRAAARS
jgi:hypothetical protein